MTYEVVFDVWQRLPPPLRSQQASLRRSPMLAPSMRFPSRMPEFVPAVFGGQA
jgi:hypothetical protein